MTLNLDLKDRKILYELDKNSRLSFPKIGKKVCLSQEVVYHRVTRLLKQGVITRFQTVVSVAKLGYFASKVYLQLQDISKETHEELQQYLHQHPNVFWFGICQGRWDLIIAYWSTDPLEFGRSMDELLNKFSQYISERAVTTSTHTAIYNRRWFIEKDEEPIETIFGKHIEQISLDEVDTALLRELAKNSRLTTVELAKKLKTTANIIRYKLRQLEKQQIISGYKIAVDIHKLGYETCKSFIYLKNITDKRRKELIEYCKRKPNVINLLTCVGSWDLEIEVEVKNFDEYYDLMEDIRHQYIDLIKNYESVIFKAEPKQLFMPQ